MRLPHGVLEQLGQDVIQRQRDEGEASRYVSVDPHSGRVTVLVLTQTPGGREEPLMFTILVQRVSMITFNTRKHKVQ